MSRSLHHISKTSFLKFEQCRKAFFLYRNFPQLRDKPSIERMMAFRRGHNVGALAQQLFPGGTDVSKTTSNSADAVVETARLLAEGCSTIYEASFIRDHTLIMVDILVKENGVFNAYEVKSSLKVSENYVRDACLQYYILSNVLPGFNEMFLVTLNPDYVREEELDLKKLFRRRSVTEKARLNQDYFRQQIAAANDLVEKNELPGVEVGIHCFRPYQCDFYGHCWKSLQSDNSIFSLPLISREKLFEIHNDGVRSIEQITDQHLPKARDQKLQKAFLKNEPVIDFQQISQFLNKVKSPVLVMDMEVWNPAIPEIMGTHCFEQLPFLVCFYDGQQFSHFMCDYEKDDREAYARALITHTQFSQTVLVYDRSLESGMISNLQKLFPQLAPPLETLRGKLLDVFEIFLNLHYYDPAFRNNFSLKTVASRLLPELSYEGISSGMEAMHMYERYRSPADLFEKETIRDQLVAYCNTDCEATFKIFDFLRRLSLSQA